MRCQKRGRSRLKAAGNTCLSNHCIIKADTVRELADMTACVINRDLSRDNNGRIFLYENDNRRKILQMIIGEIYAKRIFVDS